jgi:hypothetical protein
MASDQPITAVPENPGRAPTLADADSCPSTYKLKFVPSCTVKTTWCHWDVSTFALWTEYAGHDEPMFPIPMK